MAICLRAMRKVHLDHGLWGTGQFFTGDESKRLDNLNVGPGIEFALEPLICSAITQEFINSMFTSGVHQNAQSRFYEINRELSTDGKSVDIVINRYKYDANNNRIYSTMPVLIEAKRTDYYTPNIPNGTLGTRETKYNSIWIDIKALREIREKIKTYKSKAINFEIEHCFLYVLFWGYIDSDEESEIDLIRDINSGFEKVDECNYEVAADNCTIQYLPLKWDLVDPNKKPTKWLWICLHEIDPPQKIECKENMYTDRNGNEVKDDWRQKIREVQP